jgi:hypothetical protein
VVAQVAAEQAGNTLLENARLFALLNIAEADAGIVSWDAKYEYDFWRPVTAIRAADTDGNPATIADADWTPLIATPPFPAYTSGHSTFSAAAAAVLAEFFGTDEFAFTLESENPDAADRSFTSFSQAASESGLSRIYGGIHWSFDNTFGLSTGDAVGRFVFQNELRPISHNLDAGANRLVAALTSRLSSPVPWDTAAGVPWIVSTLEAEADLPRPLEFARTDVFELPADRVTTAVGVDQDTDERIYSAVFTELGEGDWPRLSC